MLEKGPVWDEVSFGSFSMKRGQSPFIAAQIKKLSALDTNRVFFSYNRSFQKFMQRQDTEQFIVEQK